VRRLTVVAVGVLAFVFGGSTVVQGQQAKTLHGAAATGDIPQLQKHIDNKADINAPDDNGNVPIKLAVDAYSPEAVSLLLKAGANPNVKDSAGSTPLMAACMSGQLDVVNILLEAKASPTAKNATGMTALHCAAMMGQIEIVEALIKAGADVNAKDNNGQTAIMIAQRKGSQEMVQVLQQHGGTLPVVEDPYGMAGPATQAAPVVASASRRPEGFTIDPNVIAKQLQQMTSLQTPLQTLDANSVNEQRAWVLRRSDNRTMLLRSVQKQFEDEMAFVKKVATEEKAVKTTKAVDDLVAARKKRYEKIGEELRDQRRQALQESRDTMATPTTGRGGRGSRGRGAGTTGQDAYGTTPQQARASRRTTAEPPEAPMDAETQAQVQAWLSASAEDKAALMQSTTDLDVVEYAALVESAKAEKAAKTEVAIMGLLMQREQRIATIRQRWAEDDERMQRMQERAGANGMQPGMQQGPGQGTQRGMRRGGR